MSTAPRCRHSSSTPGKHAARRFLCTESYPGSSGVPPIDCDIAQTTTAFYLFIYLTYSHLSRVVASVSYDAASSLTNAGDNAKRNCEIFISSEIFVVLRRSRVGALAPSRLSVTCRYYV